MKCVILAAGEGKRMRPLTASRPKVMLPIANRPMVEHLLLAIREAGISEFVFVVGYREKAIRDHFGDGSRFGITTEYVTQRHQRGTGDALLASEGLTGETFLLANGDMIMDSGDVSSMISSGQPAVGIFESERPWEYGVVTVEDGRVNGLVEKSSSPPSNRINAGIYLFGEDIFNLLRELPLSARGEYELTDALARYISEGTLRACQLASWMDMGSPWDLLDANAHLLGTQNEALEGEVSPSAHIQGPLVLGTGSVILPGTVVDGPCIIGRNCRIGPNAHIRGSTAIGDDCHIGHCTEVKNSIIMAGTKVPHFNYVGDSVIGSNCNFGAGTKIANLRHDHGDVMVCGRNTGRRKFGAVIGDDVLFGINCSVNVGTLIGSGSRIAPHTLVSGCYGADSIIGR